jgi:hypothetical protein
MFNLIFLSENIIVHNGICTTSKTQSKHQATGNTELKTAFCVLCAVVALLQIRPSETCLYTLTNCYSARSRQNGGKQCKQRITCFYSDTCVRWEFPTCVQGWTRVTVCHRSRVKHGCQGRKIHPKLSVTFILVNQIPYTCIIFIFFIPKLWTYKRHPMYIFFFSVE